MIHFTMGLSIVNLKWICKHVYEQNCSSNYKSFHPNFQTIDLQHSSTHHLWARKIIAIHKSDLFWYTWLLPYFLYSVTNKSIENSSMQLMVQKSFSVISEISHKHSHGQKESQFSVTEMNTVLWDPKDEEWGRKIKPGKSNSILKMH